MNFNISVFFENLTRTLKFHYNITAITGALHEDQYIFWSYLAQFFLEWKIFPKRVVEKTKTRVLCSVIFFFANQAAYEIAWKMIAEPDRPQMTIRRMLLACWITRATDTHSECVILSAFHGSNVHTKAPSSYVISTLPVLFIKQCSLPLFTFLS